MPAFAAALGPRECHLGALTVLALSGLILLGCSDPSGEKTAGGARQTLESAANEGSIENLFAVARAQASAESTTIEAINAVLRPHDRIFRPEGAGPFPTMLFFHGCSGATQSHEEDWADFYNGIGVTVIAVDSYAGRGINWEDACNLKAMTAWERAGDILATLEYARSLDFVDAENLGVTGFSHGAWTIWTTLVFASSKTPPINLEAWPAGGLDGLKLALPFYGGCHERWTIPVHTIAFLAGDDRYVDEQSCVDFAARNPDLSLLFSYHIFGGATHTFDHARPNLANVEAGSVYDAAATAESQRIIATAIETYMRSPAQTAETVP